MQADEKNTGKRESFMGTLAENVVFLSHHINHRRLEGGKREGRYQRIFMPKGSNPRGVTSHWIQSPGPVAGLFFCFYGVVSKDITFVTPSHLW